MAKCCIKRASVICVVFCVLLNCIFPVFYADASVGSLITDLVVGDEITSSGGFYLTDIYNVLSHIYEDASDYLSENFGYIWNHVLDEGYCPASSTHRHSFVYGLTSTSSTLDTEIGLFDRVTVSPTTGYYCYCEYCGQLAGDLIDQAIEDSDVDFSSSGGSITVYPELTGCTSVPASTSINSLYPSSFISYGVDYNWSELTGSPYISYGSGYIISGKAATSSRYSANFYFAADCSFISDNLSVSDFVAYHNINHLENFQNGSLVSSEDYNVPSVISRVYVSDDNVICCCFINRGTVAEYHKNYYLGDYPCYFVVNLTESSLSTLYNYDQVNAPLVYNVDGDGYFGGYSSDVVDQSSSTYYNPRNNQSYDFSSSSYDYSTNTYTLTVPDFDNDGTDENSTVTVVYGPGGLTITDPSGTYDLYYFTDTQTPVNTVTNTGSGISGTVNITVNQTSTDTNAYITTHEDIPDGLYTLRERLAVMFSSFPDMIGDVGSFLNDAFDYVPSEIRWVLGFGMTCAVFVGIFKLFFR